MSDLIKREDAIKELADYMYDVALLKADGRLNTTKHYLNLAEKSLKHIPSADRPQEWIPCSVRLPKENTEVLISLEWGIDIGEYRNGDWHSEWINHYDDDDVLAWMPLPKPWKGADDGQRISGRRKEQRMSRYIDVEFIVSESDEFVLDEGELKSISGNSAPSIDIVRCGECKYWEESQYYPKFMVCTYVIGATFTRQHDDFCSRGERKESE